MSEFVQSSVEHPMRLALYVVADGMGGHKGGEVASALAAQTFISEVMARVMAPLAAVSGERPALTNDAILQGMIRALQNANDRIYKARDNRQNDMGTTLVAALVAGGKAYAINVGDSRFYLYTKRESPPEPPARKLNIDATSPLGAGTAPLKRTQPSSMRTRAAPARSRLPSSTRRLPPLDRKPPKKPSPLRRPDRATTPSPRSR
jgi:hypothetical protein